MTKTKRNITDWLLPAVIILFLLQIIVFPFAINYTLADRSEKPNHNISYTTNKLEWEESMGINKRGAAELSVFSAQYQNVDSSNGDYLIAPGTEGKNIIRFNNKSSGAVKYIAVLYEIKSSESLPVEVSFETPNSSDTDIQALPEGVTKDQIIRTVTGEAKAGEIRDFDINWLWNFEVNDAQDKIDVDFGNKSANGNPDDVTVGFYIVVEDDNASSSIPTDNTHDYIKPITPRTGGSLNIIIYVVFMCVSAFVIFILGFKRRHKAEEQ